MLSMNSIPPFTTITRLMQSSFYLLLSFSFVMSLVRLYLFLAHAPQESYQSIDLIAAFWLGFRLDISILAYIMALPTLYLLILWLFRLHYLIDRSASIFRYYFFTLLTLVSMLLVTDIGYFSYFSEHITLMIFGIIDDDTQALFEIAKQNYNVVLLGAIAVIYLTVLSLIIKRFFTYLKPPMRKNTPLLMQIAFFSIVITAVALIGRGSIGIFPLAKDIADVSPNPLINKLPKNGVYAMVDAYEQYAKSKDGSYDLITSSGYRGKIEEAFALHVSAKRINKKDLISNLIQTTPKNEMLEKNPPHVLVVMVESFGLPILQHQSDEFDILRRLKKHFDEDTLFTNFISASNGTIVSLEPLLLNITARPKSTAFAQSTYLNTHFKQAAARVYQDAGYESSFVYGGDLSWRNIGSFMSRQGFDHQFGKASILNTLSLDEAQSSHDWGVFDQHTFDFVVKRLKEATSPQFIFILTTNNHPPYRVPASYKSKKLLYSENLLQQITGDKALAQLRLQDYQYALDMAGRFMDDIKSSELAHNTVVAITADNNTIEGIMHYDDYYNETKNIPLYLYLPKPLAVNEINTTVAGSHKDIFPTLYHLTLSHQAYISIGTNLLDPTPLHCGFNDAGVLMAPDGGFKTDKPQSEAQKRCNEYYKASLAVSEYLITSQAKVPKLSN